MTRIAMCLLLSLAPVAGAQSALDDDHAYALSRGTLRRFDRRTGLETGRLELPRRAEPDPPAAPEPPTGAGAGQPRTVRFGRLARIGRGGFCRVVSVGGTLVALRSTRTYFAHRLDADLAPGEAVRLTPEGEVDVDQDVATDGEFLYQFAMRKKPGGVLRKFDRDLALVAESEVFGGGADDMVLDQNLAWIGGRLHAGSEYREEGATWRRRSGQQNMPPAGDLVRALRVRIFDDRLRQEREVVLAAEIPGALHPRQYWGLGASQVAAGGRHCVLAASPIGNRKHFDEGESDGARQIFLLRFDADYRFVDAHGPLSDPECDNFWSTGSWFDGERYYVSYTYRRPGEASVPGPEQAGPGTGDAGNIRLAIVDRDFHLVETVDVTAIPHVDEGPGAHRSKIWMEGDRLFVSYDYHGESWIQEFTLTGRR